jgi:hypothetical protein
MTRDWLEIVGLGIGLFGLVIAARGRRIRAPRYAVRSYSIVDDFLARVPDAALLYRGQPVRALSLAFVAFWNGGRETMRREDVAQADPIVLRATGVHRILDAVVIQCSSDSIGFRIGPSNSKDSDRSIHFDYLDKDDGAVIKVFHTGTGPGALAVDGTIMGGGHPRLRQGPSETALGYVQVARLTALGVLALTVLLSWVNRFGRNGRIASVGLRGYLWVLIIALMLAAIGEVSRRAMVRWARGVPVKFKGFDRKVSLFE